MALQDLFNRDQPRRRDPYFDRLMGSPTPTPSMLGPLPPTGLQPSMPTPTPEAAPMTPEPRTDSPYNHFQNPGFDDPATNQLMQFLRTRFGQLTGPQSDQEGDAFGKLLTGGLAGGLQGQMGDVIKSLTGPAFSNPQLQQLRTGAFDSLAQQHNQQLDAEKRRLAQRGIAPTSGLYSEGLANVDRNYQQQVGQTTQNLATWELGQQNERHAQLANATQAGFGQAMSLGQALNTLGQSRRMEQNNNLTQALQLMQLPVSLTSDRLAQMMNVLNGGGQANPSNLLQTMLTLGQMNQNQNNFNTQQNAALWSALGPLLANLPIGS